MRDNSHFDKPMLLVHSRCPIVMDGCRWYGSGSTVNIYPAKRNTLLELRHGPLVDAHSDVDVYNKIAFLSPGFQLGALRSLFSMTVDRTASLWAKADTGVATDAMVSSHRSFFSSLDWFCYSFVV